MNAFLLLQWCSLPSPGLIGMSQSALTQVSSHPSADWSAFLLLCLSASPGLANNIRSCILLYALFPLCTFFRAPERLPLLVQRGGELQLAWPSIWWNQLKLFIHTQGEPQHRLMLLRKEWPWVEVAIFWEQGLACLLEGTGEISASCTFLLFSICHFCAVCLLKKRQKAEKNMLASKHTKIWDF